MCAAVDITTCHRGFHGDLNETMFVGAVSDRAKLLVQTTHECLARAIAAGTRFITSQSLKRHQLLSSLFIIPDSSSVRHLPVFLFSYLQSVSIEFAFVPPFLGPEIAEGCLLWVDYCTYFPLP